MRASSCVGRAGAVAGSIQQLERSQVPSTRITSARAPRVFVDRTWSNAGARNVAMFFKNSQVMDEPANDAAPGLPASGEDHGWMIRLLYDGDCPLCVREVNMLKERDAGCGNIDFVDISSPEYSAEDNSGISYEEAMGHIHGILPDGSVVTSIEVFRRCYEAVGLGWVYALTKYEPVRKAADAAYGVWARYRLPLTGRSDLQMVLDKKREDMDQVGCQETCELPWTENEDANKN